MSDGQQRIREILTGRLTPEGLNECSAILRSWLARPEGLSPETMREVGALLHGAGEWIDGWQWCLEDLGAAETRTGYTAAGQPGH